MRTWLQHFIIIIIIIINIIINIHDYDTRNKDKLVVNRVKLESTKRAFFFYKGADIFNNCV